MNISVRTGPICIQAAKLVSLRQLNHDLAGQGIAIDLFNLARKAVFAIRAFGLARRAYSNPGSLDQRADSYARREPKALAACLRDDGRKSESLRRFQGDADQDEIAKAKSPA